MSNNSNAVQESTTRLHTQNVAKNYLYLNVFRECLRSQTLKLIAVRRVTESTARQLCSRV